MSDLPDESSLEEAAWWRVGQRAGLPPLLWDTAVCKYVIGFRRSTAEQKLLFLLNILFWRFSIEFSLLEFIIFNVLHKKVKKNLLISKSKMFLQYSVELRLFKISE